MIFKYLNFIISVRPPSTIIKIGYTPVLEWGDLYSFVVLTVVIGEEIENCKRDLWKKVYNHLNLYQLSLLLVILNHNRIQFRTLLIPFLQIIKTKTNFINNSSNYLLRLPSNNINLLKIRTM